MNIEEMLYAFEHCENGFPAEAIDAALDSREEITPALLRILEEAPGQVQKYIDNSENNAHIIAMFLLAQFREQRAYPLLVDFFSLPDDLLSSAVIDLPANGLHRLLASVCHGDLSLIKGLVENEQLSDEYVRGSALDALVVLLVEGVLTREEVVDYFRTLYHGGLPRKESFVWNALVDASSDIYPGELLEEMKQAYRDDLADPGYISPEEVEHHLEIGQDATLAQLAQSPYRQYIVDAKTELKAWVCCNDNSLAQWCNDEVERIAKEMGPELTEYQSPRLIMTPAPAQTTPTPALIQTTPTPALERTTPKVGRNQPCPCGSGKKYKQCCGR